MNFLISFELGIKTLSGSYRLSIETFKRSSFLMIGELVFNVILNIGQLFVTHRKIATEITSIDQLLNYFFNAIKFLHNHVLKSAEDKNEL